MRGGKHYANALRFNSETWTFDVVCVQFWRKQWKELQVYSIADFLASKEYGKSSLLQMLDALPERLGFYAAQAEPQYTPPPAVKRKLARDESSQADQSP